jgi:hypothetical protein
LSLPVEEMRGLRGLANAAGVSVSRYIRDLIADELIQLAPAGPFSEKSAPPKPQAVPRTALPPLSTSLGGEQAAKVSRKPRPEDYPNATQFRVAENAWLKYSGSGKP